MQCAPMSIKWLQSPQVSLWGDSSGGTQVIQTLLTLAHRRNQNLPAVAIRSPLPSAFRLCIHCLLPAIRVCLHRLFNCLARAYPPPFQLSFARVSTAFSPPFLSISSAVTFSAWLDLTCANPGYRAEQYCTGSCLDMGSPDPVRDRNERPGRPSSETNTAFLLWRHRLYISGNTAYLLWKHRLCSRCCCRG